MDNQVYNPYLPDCEYIPDGEPRVFGERLFIYGSHDRFNGWIFCLNDYVCYSAPLDDLSDWRYEGVIYKKRQDPNNKLGLRLLFAPDVVQGVDGRYYLYYTLDFSGLMGVAVCEHPAGEYKFVGHIRFPNKKVWGRSSGDQLPFDPGVLVDGNKVYLYSGFYKKMPRFMTGFKKLNVDGGVVLELERDMMTIKSVPHLIFPKDGEGSFVDHEFFEASSMRKIGNKYYFIYSSKHNHELCYAISDKPMGEFSFGGTLVSLGDLFLDGNEKETQSVNYLGNTHGSIVKIHDRWYVFYHRHTNRHSYSRQGCAEPLVMTKDGHFEQAELTSCGLNSGSLLGEGRYEARIACNLWSKDGVGRYDCFWPRARYRKHPYFTQDGKDRNHTTNQHIANIRDGSVAGFKFFHIKELKKISERVRGKAEGEMLVSVTKEFDFIAARIPIMLNNPWSWSEFVSKCSIEDGEHPIFFCFLGRGSVDFLSFELHL